jgi:DNA-directed RNA polymerase subunit F
LLIGEVAEKLTPEERETAIDEVIELGGAIDGLLAQQIGLNIEALEKVTGRMFTAAEKEEITTKTQRAWRWIFLVSGLEHPNVVKTVGELTTAGPVKIKGSAEALSA